MVWVKAVQTEMEEERLLEKIPSYFGKVSIIDFTCFGCGLTIPAGDQLNNLQKPRCFDCRGEFVSPQKEFDEEEQTTTTGATPFGKIGMKCESCGKFSIELATDGQLQCLNESCSQNEQLASRKRNPQDNVAAPQRIQPLTGVL